MLWRKGKLVIGPDNTLRRELLELMHSSTIGGHSGIHAMTQRLLSLVYWKGTIKDIRQFIRLCPTCQQNKSETIANSSLLQPLQVPAGIFTYVTKDFISGFPK